MRAIVTVFVVFFGVAYSQFCCDQRKSSPSPMPNSVPVQAEDANEHEEAKEMAGPKTDWKQLRIQRHEIKSIKIDIHGKERPNKVIFRRTPVQIVTVDPIDFTIAEVGLGGTYALRFGFSDDVVGGSGGTGMRWGLIEIERNKGPSIIISATPDGFGVGSKGADFNNVFHSLILAKLIDDLYFQKTGERLPTEVFQSLSGEKWIKSSQIVYANIRARASKK